MKELVRCKACCLVISKENLKKKCPACGVSSAAFESYKENFSPNRKRIIDLHLHPIIVHFPQAFTVILPFLFLGATIIETSLGKQMIITAHYLAQILPFTVAVALLSGLIDGKVRFNKLTTPYLIKKMIAGFLLLVFTMGMSYIVFAHDLTTVTYFPFLILNICSILCQIYLGNIGIKLMYAIMPG